MEKLIVKNFGPIKEAEIDLTKYVVFIGDTSTGKSVLAKLIGIFRDSLFRYPNDIGKLDFKKELIHYNIDFNYSDSHMEYFKDNYVVKLIDNNLKSNRDVVNEDDKRKMFDYFNEIVKQNPQFKFDKDIASLLDSAIEGLQNKRLTIYIPAERILNSLVGSSGIGLWANNVILPECIKDFAAQYQFAKAKHPELSLYDFGFIFKNKNDVDYVLFQNSEILLTQSSSGIQSLIPLLVVIEDEFSSQDSIRKPKTILIEEPELNLFPSKQKKLTEFLTERISTSTYKLIITTHSPYILSVLDTLMLAKNTFNEHPDLKEEIAAIVSEDKWIDYNDISVYEVRNDGTIKSIKNEEFKSIDTNAIDGVSDIISGQFDKLTELRYAQ